MKVLLPANVKSDKPFLVRLPAPSMMPFKLRSLLPATVRPAFSVMLLPMPNEALLSSVATLSTIKAPLPRPLALPRVSVPPLSVVPPLKLLLALRVRFAAPFLINWPVPLVTPPSVRFCVPPTVSAEFKATALLRLTSGELLSRVEAPATVSVPEPNAELLPTVRVPALSLVPAR